MWIITLIEKAREVSSVVFNTTKKYKVEFENLERMCLKFLKGRRKTNCFVKGY